MFRALDSVEIASRELIATPTPYIQVKDTMKDPTEAITLLEAKNAATDPVPLPWEDFGVCAEAAQDVVKVIQSGKTCYWRGGPKTMELEALIAKIVGRKEAFFHNSGSAALLTALYALGVQANDNVAITSSGFVASLNALYHRRARPVFLPTAVDTLVVADDVSEWIDEDIHTVLLTQFLGNVVNLECVKKTARAAHVIEDASQALGSKWQERYVGSHSDIATFAGSQKKLLGSGKGGVNLYDDAELGERMRVLAHHGKGHTQYREVPGYNFFGGEIEATLAIAALKNLDERARLRRECALGIMGILDQAGITYARPPVGVRCEVTWFDVAIILPENWIGYRDALVKGLVHQGVPAWSYPALIDMPWVKMWMKDMSWWSEREDELLKREKCIWDRVLVIGTQLMIEDAKRCSQKICETIAP